MRPFLLLVIHQPSLLPAMLGLACSPNGCTLVGAHQAQRMPELRDCAEELPWPWYTKGSRRNMMGFRQ
ncbi:hypothetical protein B5X24_HaOG206007 [Helicoverpa armigera]|uniref:Secreted protein n=1 Tax=Helicoverpa armigera TaxID=29058 RepID=A0A2W1BQW0_HELAM|nr:hypothetical protein B5X24_HaOG206007 [Helicoverpa armigera]